MSHFSSSFSGEPEWHRVLPSHLQFINRALVADLERFRKELGLDDEVFSMVLLQSKTDVRAAAKLIVMPSSSYLIVRSRITSRWSLVTGSRRK
ncbi:MAG: hypothetical protein DME71_03745 [Verrucomicrobia bacterium]|nr:MAG: hypothetical protein DME71_03745 [Verrucomicrobiota bacterium]